MEFIYIACLLFITQNYASTLEKRYDSENSRTQTVYINGQPVQVNLPDGNEGALPQTSSATLQFDERVDNQSLALFPPSNASQPDSPAASTSPASLITTGNLLPPTPNLATNASASLSSNASASHPTDPSHVVAPLQPPPPSITSSHNGTDAPAPVPLQTSPTTSPPHFSSESSPPHASSAIKPMEKTPQDASFVITGFMPFFGPASQFFYPFFGTIYPVYTQSPIVIQYVAQPTVYYMQVIQIVHSLVPKDVLPLNSIMDLSMALTNILRSSAENLDSVLVEDTDGPSIAPDIQVSEDQGFRSALTGDPLDIPTPNDVTNQIQNVVQKYAEAAPEEIQNVLIKNLSENMSELLKPLYQNIAYTQKLRFDDVDSQQQSSQYQTQDQQGIYRREFHLNRRSPEETTTVPAIAAVKAINDTANNVVNAVNNLTNMTPHTPVTAIDPNTNSNLSALGTNTVVNPNATYPLAPTTSTPFLNQPPVVIKNNYIGVSTSAGSDLIDQLLNSATSPFSSILSLIPNPFKIAYNIMNTIATVYPKIQLSILVGLSTAITQIVAKVLQIIASFVGIFASIGRRDLSSIDLSQEPSTLDMTKVLNDLHTDIKEAVHTYLPEAPVSKKKELTSALYSNSLDVISEAITPMQEQVNKQNQEIPQPQVEAPAQTPYSNNDMRSKTDIFGFPDQSVAVGISNNQSPVNDLMGGSTLFGASDSLGKQIDQLTSDLGQDILVIPNFQSNQQNVNQNNNFWSTK